MTSFEKIKKFCNEYGLESEQPSEHRIQCKFGNKESPAFITGWKDSDRIDLEERGMDFIFDIDDIRCFPNKEDCSVIGRKDFYNNEVHALINLNKGIEQITAEREKDNATSPIMTVHIR